MFADASEPSRHFAFAGNRLERMSENRAADALDTVLADPATRALGFARGRVVVDVGARDALAPLDTFAPYGPKPARAVWLGNDEAGPVIALPLGTDPVETGMPERLKAIDYRSLAAQALLSPEQTGMVAQGAALLAWNTTHRFCSRCGHESNPVAGGYKRVCPACEAEHFPRTDPVVIMLAVRGDRCLLGRGRHFPEGMYSALAGFVEPGETIEDAVRRETLEESGIAVGRVRYHGTQPWPFPHTLMIGCFAEALDEGIDYDAEELADCRWFGRGEVAALVEDAGAHRGVGSEGDATRFFVPPPMAIAHQLMRAWALGEVG